MTINIDFRTKGTCDMASHAYKMHNVEKMFRTYTKVNVQKKAFLNYIKNIPHHRETNISHNVDFDFLYNRILNAIKTDSDQFMITYKKK